MWKQFDNRVKSELPPPRSNRAPRGPRLKPDPADRSTISPDTHHTSSYTTPTGSPTCFTKPARWASVSPPDVVILRCYDSSRSLSPHCCNRCICNTARVPLRGRHIPIQPPWGTGTRPWPRSSNELGKTLHHPNAPNPPANSNHRGNDWDYPPSAPATPPV